MQQSSSVYCTLHFKEYWGQGVWPAARVVLKFNDELGQGALLKLWIMLLEQAPLESITVGSSPATLAKPPGVASATVVPTATAFPPTAGAPATAGPPAMPTAGPPAALGVPAAQPPATTGPSTPGGAHFPHLALSPLHNLQIKIDRICNKLIR